MEIVKREYAEKERKPLKGFTMLAIIIVSFLISIALFVYAGYLGGDFIEDYIVSMVLCGVCGSILMIATIIFPVGFKIVNPNEAVVLTLFGKYYGTIKKDGFWWVNPFCTSLNPGRETSEDTDSNTLVSLFAKYAGKKKLSLKAMTLNNDKQKVNDEDGNPIEIGVVVIWKIVDTAKAVFAVNNYIDYLSSQTDAAIRQVARLYPYDVSIGGDEKSLRGSSQEIAEELRKEIQGRMEIAGIEVLEARISHLAYSPEIAAAMLQRQQAKAIIDARQKIVEGAVGMVEMALNKLSENKVVELDDEKKATMVSNLLVVLCGNKDAQPVVNSGSI